MSEFEKQTSELSTSEEGSLIDQIMQETRIKPTDEGYETAKKGVEAFISDLLEPQRRGEKVEQKVVDDMIAPYG
jgi:type VI secretion system protein ImpC